MEKRTKGGKGSKKSAGQSLDAKAKAPSNDPMAPEPDQELISLQSDPTSQALQKMMSECSLKAKKMRKNITDALQQTDPALEAPGQEQGAGHSESDPTQARSLNATNLEIKQILEKNIKEKLADLEEALRDNSPKSDKDSVGGGDQVTPKTESDAGAVSGSGSGPGSGSGTGAGLSKSDSTGKCPEAGDDPVEVKPIPKETTISATQTGQDVKPVTTETTTESNATIEATNSTAATKAKKQNKASSGLRKGGQKDKSTADHILKSLSSCGSDAEKLGLLCKKYVDLLDENRSLEQQSKQQEKACLQIAKEKEQLQCDHNRSVLAKSRLESLCRELQRHNKAVKEESLLKIKEEEDKRKDIASKFQVTLNEIMQLVQENQQRNLQLKDENSELATKLKSLMDHYESWEKNIGKIIQQKDLESQLIRAKLAKTSALLNQEKEQFLNEKQQLINMITDLQKRGSELSANELHLRAELSLYTSKYEEFQTVLSKSNEMFNSFKKDMEKMSKQIKRLEKETLQWKSKWESSNKALILLAEEKSKRDTDLVVAVNKTETLQKLCRALQEERTKMQSQLKLQEEGYVEVSAEEMSQLIETSVQTN